MNQESNVPVRVFLVEDMPGMQRQMSDLLHGTGSFTLVATATTEADAVQWMKENRGQWDLAIVDLVLAHGSGMGVVARCRDRDPAAKVVVYSEYVTPVIHDYCISLGADAALSKADVQAFTEFCSSLVRR